MNGKKKHPILTFFDLLENLKSSNFELHSEIEKTVIPKIPNVDKNQKQDFLIDISKNSDLQIIFLKYNLIIDCDLETVDRIPVVLLESAYSIPIQTLLFSYKCFLWSFSKNIKRESDMLCSLIHKCLDFENSKIK